MQSKGSGLNFMLMKDEVVVVVEVIAKIWTELFHCVT